MPRSRRWRLLGTAAVVVAALTVAAVYVTVPRQGNLDPACRETAALAATLLPFSRGEVAAFQPAATPVNIGSLALEGPDGNPAALSFTGPDGQPVTMADFAGKTVLLNLWATWCIPCREEMPALDRLHAAEAGDDFIVLALNLDRPDVDARAFLDDLGVTALPYYADPSLNLFHALQARSMVVGLPTTILIDQRGCHLGIMNGPAEWVSADAVALVDAAKTARPPPGA